jgi:type I restriction enzyme R subunit
MPLGSESGSVQRPFVRYAVDAGWHYLSPDQALELRSWATDRPILDSVLISQLQKLNPGIVDVASVNELVRRLTHIRPNIEGNLEAWEFLKGEKNVFVAAEGQERRVRFLDPGDIEANTFHVTQEFMFSNGTPPNVRADIVFFINGIPILLVETKRATALDGIAQALDDIRYYHEKAPEFLALNQLYAITHLIDFLYGATWSTSAKSLLDWHDDAVPEADFEALCKSFVAPRRVLHVITDSILFVRKDEVLSKIVLRPHQMRAVDRCVQRVKDPVKHRGLVWHTQGSGKTYTMMATARHLLEESGNPTILMIVDRNELQQQLFTWLGAAGFGAIPVARSKADLERLLREGRRGLIVTMIHKFDDMPPDVNLRQDIYVLVDEAHRSTNGDLGNYLLGALPNATFIGFTGTPIDKTAKGKGTFKVFGMEDRKGYLDKYSIRESIQDGTTVPLHYDLAPNELKVDKGTLEREFLNLAEAEGVSEFEDLNAILEKEVTLCNMLKNKDRVDKVAKYVATHFKDNVEPMGYKAFLVAVDREACCLYKEAIDKYLDPSWSTVDISQAGKKDPASMRQYYLSDEEEKTLRKEFIKPETTPKILIVTEKLLTGFDAPILYAMYLDKPMRDHVLLQAIARVNRPYEDNEGRRKSCGFVLDFVGIFDNLEKALAFDSEDVSGVVTGLDVLRERFVQLMDGGQQQYLTITAGLHADKAVEAALEHFRDKEPRERFYNYFRELQDTYEILSPDAFLRPYLAYYEELLRLFLVVRANYDRARTLDHEFLRKTANLVQEDTAAGEIAAPSGYHALTPDVLDALSKENKPDIVRVFNLLVALNNLVNAKAGAEPYLLSIGERAEQIRQAFEDRQRTTQETLESLQAIIAQIANAGNERQTSGLSERAFALYYVLNEEGDLKGDPRAIAAQIETVFARHPHWQRSGGEDREARIGLYRVLIDAGAVDPTAVAEKLLALLQRIST